jgi:hypothetical protein
MSYTLADFAQVAKSNIKRGVIDVLRRESFIMDKLPWEKTGSLSMQVMRTKGVPSVAFRKIGETFSESKATIEPVVERVFDCGGYFDIDKVLMAADAEINQAKFQADSFVTSLAYQFNDYFISGDPTVDVDGFAGLRYRLMGGDLPAALSVDAGGINVGPGAATEALDYKEFNKLYDYVEQAQHELNGHKADVILVNNTMFLRFISGLRRLRLLATTKNALGQTLSTWGEGGPVILDLGVKADQTTKILTDTETATGVPTGGALSSVFLAKLGGNFLNGFYLYDIDVNGPYKLENGVAFRTVIDWPVGIYHWDERAFARVYNIDAINPPA